MSQLRGRFAQPPSSGMQRFASSLDVDSEMLSEEIEVSRAHARMLGEVGILTDDETAALLAGLEQVGRELAEGLYQPGDEHEDIHMAVEARLIEIAGDVGRKLHTARSRNDQVATDVRLWVKRRLRTLDEALGKLLEALLQRVESDGRILMPGYTHLQRGQPILLGHHLLAHAWALCRDRGRLRDALARLDACPLGACALAGTPHPIDRERTAELLGFAGVVENAADAVAARDYQIEAAGACAIIMSHVSRMAAELVLWSSSEFRFVRLSDAFATGSSIMPQKRNPDAAELLRGKTARVFGDLLTLLTLVKGLPLTYNRDLQEDREALFDAMQTTLSCCRILEAVWRDLRFEAERFRDELEVDFSLATELADALVQRGTSFRDAHDRVSRLVRNLEDEGRDMTQLTNQELEELDPGATTDDLRGWLNPEASVERRRTRGGTAWGEVQRQVEQLRTLANSMI